MLSLHAHSTIRLMAAAHTTSIPPWDQGPRAGRDCRRHQLRTTFGATTTTLGLASLVARMAHRLRSGSPVTSRAHRGAAHVRNHDRRQSAETRLARRAEHAVAAVEAGGRRTRRSEARRDAAGDQAAGGRRHRHRHRRRAVAAAFRARLPGECRRDRLRQARRNGHPQQPLQGDGADSHRRAAAARPRARHRGAGRHANIPRES